MSAALPSPFDLALKKEIGLVSAVELGSQSNLTWSGELPGHGEPCDRGTEWRHWAHRAEEDLHVVAYQDSCDRFDCPRHGREGWARREAGLVKARVERESAARMKTGKLFGICHVIVSPPPGRWDGARTANEYRCLRSEAYRRFKAAGGEGGTFIFHPLRCADKADPLTTWGPHFHVLGFGRFREWNATGWNVKNTKLVRTVFGTAFYALTHAGRYLRPEEPGSLPKGNSRFQTEAVTHVGKLTIGPVEQQEGRFCPICKAHIDREDVLHVEWVGQGPPPEEPVVGRLSDWRTWTLDRTAGWGGTVRVGVEW